MKPERGVTISLLVQKDADVGAENKNGMTPFSIFATLEDKYEFWRIWRDKRILKVNFWKSHSFQKGREFDTKERKISKIFWDLNLRTQPNGECQVLSSLLVLFRTESV